MAHSRFMHRKTDQGLAYTVLCCDMAGISGLIGEGLGLIGASRDVSCHEFAVQDVEEKFH